MGFSAGDDDVEESLANTTTDLNWTKGLRGVSVNFEYQRFQAWHCMRQIQLMHGPTACPMSEYASRGAKMLEDLEAKLVQVQQNIYPPSRHSGPFPKMECNLDWGRGGNFSRAAAGEDTPHRKCPLFIYEAKDKERIFAIVRECKRLELEQTIFSDKVFWQIIPVKSD